MDIQPKWPITDAQKERLDRWMERHRKLVETDPAKLPRFGRLEMMLGALREESQSMLWKSPADIVKKVDSVECAYLPDNLKRYLKMLLEEIMQNPKDLSKIWDS